MWPLFQMAGCSGHCPLAAGGAPASLPLHLSYTSPFSAFSMSCPPFKCFSDLQRQPGVVQTSRGSHKGRLKSPTHPGGEGVLPGRQRTFPHQAMPASLGELQHLPAAEAPSAQALYELLRD